jgi:hypothetical protein
MRYDLFIDMSSSSLRLRSNIDEELIGTVYLIDVKLDESIVNKAFESKSIDEIVSKTETKNIDDLITQITDIKSYTKEHEEIYNIKEYNTSIKRYNIDFYNNNTYDNDKLVLPPLLEEGGPKPGIITLNRPLKAVPSTPINNKYRYIIDWKSSEAVGLATVTLNPETQPTSIGQNLGFKGYFFYDLLPSTSYTLQIITYNNTKSLNNYQKFEFTTPSLPAPIPAPMAAAKTEPIIPQNPLLQGNTPVDSVINLSWTSQKAVGDAVVSIAPSLPSTSIISQNLLGSSGKIQYSLPANNTKNLRQYTITVKTTSSTGDTAQSEKIFTQRPAKPKGGSHKTRKRSRKNTKV